MVRVKTAEVQMPFYMAYVWGYEKAFGTGEWALRFATAPWWAAGFTFLTMALRRRGLPIAFSMAIFGLSPFAWYYLNEARLYAMQLGVSAFLLAMFVDLTNERSDHQSELSSVRSLIVGVVLLSSISMLGMIWA